jgi:hypothetical protein
LPYYDGYRGRGYFGVEEGTTIFLGGVESYRRAMWSEPEVSVSDCNVSTFQFGNEQQPPSVPARIVTLPAFGEVRLQVMVNNTERAGLNLMQGGPSLACFWPVDNPAPPSWPTTSFPGNFLQIINNTSPLALGTQAMPRVMAQSADFVYPDDASRICHSCEVNGVCASYCTTCGKGQSIIAPCPVGKW